MKIKTKKQLNLPQLIEWAWENDVRDKVFWTTKDNRGVSYEACFSEFGSFYSDDILDSNVIFTIEVEEEITEDTEFDIIVLIEKDSCSATWANNSINKLKDNRSKEFHAYIDGEFKLIWRDGKLVE